ncbi:hypothetical protein Q7P37_011008 [Cladosporium fusiforme]
MARKQEDWETLCCKVKDCIPEPIGPEAWYLVIAATLASSPDPSLPAAFYTYLTQHDQSFASHEAQEQLSARLGDLLLKLISLVGGPQVLSCLIPLAEAEGNVKAKSNASKLNAKWEANGMSVSSIYDRGEATINSIYGRSLLSKVFESFGTHREDVKFTEIFTLYGLYLSDFKEMTPLETEAVVYSSISCLGLGGPGNWHLRGMGRLLGARGSDDGSEEMKKILRQLEGLKEAVVGVVNFVGGEFLVKAKLEKWASAEDVLEKLGGWGDD